MANSEILTTAEKTLSVLTLVSESGTPLTMSEVSEKSGLSSTITFRILKTLEKSGYLIRGAGKKYSATTGQNGSVSLMAALSLLKSTSNAGSGGASEEQLAISSGLSQEQIKQCTAAFTKFNLIESNGQNHWAISPGILTYATSIIQRDATLLALRPLMHDLAIETGETVTWFRRIGDEQVVTETVLSTNPVRYALAEGSHYPLHRGAAGKACLSTFSDDDIIKYLQSVDKNGSAVNHLRLMKELQNIRKIGYATSNSERVKHASATAVAVKGFNGQYAGVLGIMAPSFRMTQIQLDEHGKALTLRIKQLFSTNEHSTDAG